MSLCRISNIGPFAIFFEKGVKYRFFQNMIVTVITVGRSKITKDFEYESNVLRSVSYMHRFVSKEFEVTTFSIMLKQSLNAYPGAC